MIFVWKSFNFPILYTKNRGLQAPDRRECGKIRTTDMADELFRGPETELPAGVRLATAKRGGVTVTRVEIAREGLARPRGRYVTLEMPSVSVLDERDTDVILSLIHI